MEAKKKVLFVCSQNKLRSPTAEKVFSSYPGIEVLSAGTNNDAEVGLSPELVLWADIIFVMEEIHKNKLQKKFGKYLNKQRVIVLNIPDRYYFMDSELVSILTKIVPGLL